jgi:lipopolysaccharide biosynthesis regulator YciM
MVAQGNFDQAQQLFREAIARAPDAARPRIEFAQLLGKSGEFLLAHQQLIKALENAPTATPLIAAPLADMAIQSGNTLPTLAHLQTLYEQGPSLDVLDAIVKLSVHCSPQNTSAREWYARHLEKEPSLVAAAKWIAEDVIEHRQFHPQVQRALEHAVKPLLRYRCAACGFEAMQHFWQCPGCQAWDSYPCRRVEEL